MIDMKRWILTLCLLAAALHLTAAEKFNISKAVFLEAESVTVTSSGRIWISYRGNEEVDGQDIVALKSSADGKKWEDSPLIVKDASRSVLWADESGCLHLFCCHSDSTFHLVSRNPESSSPDWSSPEAVCGGYPCGSPVSMDGNIVLPVMRQGVGPGVCVCSSGIWQYRSGPADTPELQKAVSNDPGLYVSADGRLMMALCSIGTGWSYISESPDEGRTWSKPRHFCYNPLKDFAVESLGEYHSVLLVKCARYDHCVYHLCKGLYAYLTTDDGMTWYGGLQVDAREGAENPKVTARDGIVHIVYTYNNSGVNELVYARTSVPAIANAWGTLETPPEYKRTIASAGKSMRAYEDLPGRLYTSRKVYKSAPLKVATYNIEYLGYVKTPTWEQRIPVIKQIFEDEHIEVIGTQEPDTMMVRTLLDALGPDWGAVGTVETNPVTGSQLPVNPIFWRKSSVELLDSGHFGYNDAPGTAGWDSWIAGRLCTWARFRVLESGQEFFIFNSHLDHRGMEAKAYSPIVLQNMIQKLAPDMPVFCTGDFNFTEKTEGYRRMLSCRWLDDAMLALPEDKRENWEYFSMSNFKPMSTVAKSHTHLDHIFYTPANSRVLTWKMVTWSKDGVFGSDHLPVVIDWQLGE